MMEQNLELRKAVAEINGCRAVIRTINDLAGIDNTYLFCECSRAERFNSHSEWVNGKLLVIPYELDHHAALDALMEFCEKNGYEWEVRLMKTQRYDCTIWKHEPALHLMADEFNDSLAICICEAIKAASQKSEKKEAGE